MLLKFYICNLQMFILSFVPSLIYKSKTGACPSDAPFRLSTVEEALSCSRKYHTRLVRLGRKNTGLMRTCINYSRKKIYNLGPWWPEIFREVGTIPSSPGWVTGPGVACQLRTTGRWCLWGSALTSGTHWRGCISGLLISTCSLGVWLKFQGQMS